MDRRRNDLNALRKAREHLLEIGRLETQSESLLKEIQEAKKECNRDYAETHRKDYPTTQEKQYYDLLNNEWKRNQNEKGKKRDEMRKKLTIFLSVGLFIVFAVLTSDLDPDEDTAAYFLHFGGLVACYIILFITNRIMAGATKRNCKEAYTPTKDEKKRLAQYAEQDARNAEEFKNYVQRKKDEANRRAKEIGARNNAKIRELERKIYDSYIALQQLDILGKNEQNLDAVNALINIMESHRADSIPEALRVYDAQRHYHNQAAQALFNERMNILEQKWQRQDQFDRDMAAAAHRNRMEKLQQDQLDILERERRDNEYYRRYGKQS